MLHTLAIRNLALLSDVTIIFGNSFNVITGETGAGKTLLVQALALLSGEKAAQEVIRSGEEETQLTAVFQFQKTPETVSSILQEGGIAESDELILKRILTREGKNRVIVNGEPTTLQVLKKLGTQLFDIASQHQQQELLDPSKHLGWLDAWSEVAEERKIVQENFAAYRNVVTQMEGLKFRRDQSLAQLDFLKYQLQELEAAKLKEGEEEELLAVRDRLKYRTKLQQAVEEACAKIETAGVAQGQRVLEKIAALEPAAASWIAALETARVHLEETARDLDRYKRSFQNETYSLESVEDRIALLQQLKRKHHCEVAGLLEKQKTLKADVDSVESFDVELERFNQELEMCRHNLEKSEQLLRRKRKKGALTLAAEVEKGLQEVCMPKTVFEIVFTEKPLAAWTEEGGCDVRFFISPNVGEPLKPLETIASGGEISRVLLVLKQILVLKTAGVTTIILDEIDVGIGGDAAVSVGEKVAELAKKRQVICVTHLAPIAAKAATHFQVQKAVVGERTLTDFQKLSQGERVEEIARMLAGSQGTKRSRAHAEELLNFSFPTSEKTLYK